MERDQRPATGALPRGRVGGEDKGSFWTGPWGINKWVAPLPVPCSVTLTILDGWRWEGSLAAAHEWNNLPHFFANISRRKSVFFLTHIPGINRFRFYCAFLRFSFFRRAVSASRALSLGKLSCLQLSVQQINFLQWVKAGFQRPVCPSSYKFEINERWMNVILPNQLAFTYEFPCLFSAFETWAWSPTRGWAP